MWGLLAVAYLIAEASAAAASNSAPSSVSLPVGQLVEKVPCAEHPSESYALYLPSRYTPERAWPIVYVLDPRSRGALGAEQFRSGAEQLGYIIASSNNSRSDGPSAPNILALQAMWPDTHARLHIDDRRVYGAGFSGTVRSLCEFARAVPKLFAGMIAAGGGFPIDAPPRLGDSFAFFATVGNRDQNYYELLDLEPALVKAGLRHRIEIFDGVHAWPGESLATQSLKWMELEAMRSGALLRDRARIDALYKEDLERALSLERRGERGLAERAFSSTVRDFAELANTSEAARHQAELLSDVALQRELFTQAQRRKNDQAFLEASPRILAGVGEQGEALTISQALERLKIAELRKQAQHSATSDERLSAQRILASLGVHSSFYLPQHFSEQKRYARADFALSMALEIEGPSSGLFYRRAAVRAKSGDRAGALSDLQRAVASGFADGAALERDADFDSLRQETGYRQLLRGLAPVR